MKYIKKNTAFMILKDGLQFQMKKKCSTNDFLNNSYKANIGKCIYFFHKMPHVILRVVIETGNSEIV